MKWKPMCVALVTAMLLTSCAATGRANNSYCQVAKPILVGKDDQLTDITARQILEHNRTGRKICGW